MPMLSFGELDAERWEKWKVEIYRDGSMAPASEEFECGEIFLSIDPIPTLTEIASDARLEPSEITAEEFERGWEQALANPRWPLTKIG